MGEEIQRKLQSEVENFKASQKELQKAITNRQQLDGQLNENKIVKDELNLLKSEAVVYKSLGPILIKTELSEAKQNITKRIAFITKELERIDTQIEGLEKKQDSYKGNIQKLQQQYQQMQMKAALKA
ncbi:prefoldin subunit 6 [Atheta coriaria]|uniref:prefoldin subunit 6 n=1 Tax=Dalotia coriaria TaxID=877792 RepID=UPI0031F41EF2